ncbi:hypothetical protein [Kineococcus rubinsiae]|uniref:hypothetical protein n=1 Tax=Kineococcus rubinsiae TaxID=2609562 RepID=UPI001431BA69|nr:hypothetical protein [Kineococcus rubinsiae]NIZ92437.1 hypothetical protein [Kineococcus rubinsiae]
MSAEEDLARATGLLRAHTDSTWSGVREAVLARAAAAFRPSAPVRGRHALGDFLVASDVVVAQLRTAVDAVPGATAARILCTTGEEDVLQQVVVELSVRFGESLHEVAAAVRAAVVAELAVLLGALSPGADGVRADVHVTDVDPRD